jgi:nitrite reductase/ring-hydroxylating ferredoxin subunit
MNRQQLGPVEDIPEGGSKGYTINGETLFAVKKAGQVFLYRNNCPHANLPLEWVPDQFLDHSGTLIQCANHGALFVIETGECVSRPCAGQTLEAVACTLEDGEIYCYL